MTSQQTAVEGTFALNVSFLPISLNETILLEQNDLVKQQCFCMLCFALTQ